MNPTKTSQVSASQVDKKAYHSSLIPGATPSSDLVMDRSLDRISLGSLPRTHCDGCQSAYTTWNRCSYCKCCFERHRDMALCAEREEKDLIIEKLHRRSKRYEKLATWNESMLKSGIHSDVTLVVSEEKIQIPAHRAVLASRSPVFQAMFEQPMSESSSGVIELDDIPASSLRAFLSFLYSGHVDPDTIKEHGPYLLAAAHKYDVVALKEAVEPQLVESINIEKVFFLLKFAMLYEAPSLKEACWDCIRANMKDESIRTQIEEIIHEKSNSNSKE